MNASSPIRLSLGLLDELPPTALAGWGCITPFWGGKMADPFSAEQDCFARNPEDLQGLKQWLTTVGLTKLERQLRTSLLAGDWTGQAEVCSRQYVLMGSAKGTSDQLFLTAWKLCAPQRRGGFSTRQVISSSSGEFPEHRLSGNIDS